MPHILIQDLLKWKWLSKAEGRLDLTAVEDWETTVGGWETTTGGCSTLSIFRFPWEATTWYEDGEDADEEGTAVSDETNGITEGALFPWEGADWCEEDDVAHIANEDEEGIPQLRFTMQYVHYGDVYDITISHKRKHFMSPDKAFLMIKC